jgi:hypothetical protein
MVVVKTIPVRTGEEVTWGLTNDTEQDRKGSWTVEEGILMAGRPVPVRWYGGPIGSTRWSR